MTHNPAQRELRDYISETSEHADVRPGSPLPFGNQELSGGVNFAIFSRNASRVRLELFDHPEDAAPARAIELDPARNRTGDVWHNWVAVRSSTILLARKQKPAAEGGTK